MMMILKDIKQYTKELKKELKTKISAFDDPPTLAIIQIGEVEASNRYVNNKIKDCTAVGIMAHRYWYSDKITENELIEEIEHLAPFYDGLIVQLPLPAHIRPEAVVAAIPEDVDVDGFKHESVFEPATPKGIMDYLRYCGFDFVGKDVTIIGRSEIVGKPLAQLMCAADATVTLCHSKSKLDKHIEGADLIVCAVGKPHFLNCYSIHVPVIDVGINFDEDGKMIGDCYNCSDRDVTPVPGGVGLLTRCALLDNVVRAKQIKDSQLENFGNSEVKK